MLCPHGYPLDDPNAEPCYRKGCYEPMAVKRYYDMHSGEVEYIDEDTMPDASDLLDMLEALAKNHMEDGSMSISPHTALELISGYREQLNLRTMLADSARREAAAHDHIARLERRIDQLST